MIGKRTYKFLSFPCLRTAGTSMTIFLSALLLLAFLPAPSSSESAQITPRQNLSEGKNLLDRGDYENAIAHLTIAYENLPVMGDYALFWRAQAFKNIGNVDDAIADLRTIKSHYKDSPLIKAIRLLEIELLREKNNTNEIINAYQNFIADYPSDFDVKYAFALYLYENNEKDRAKNLFKEIFLSASPLSKKAAEKLPAGEITIKDLILRGQNLNKAWFFEDAEKSFREALKKTDLSTSQPLNLSTSEILQGLAYSLFRQKRYKEASALYEEINNPFWLARSLLRARETKTFESRLQEFMRSEDNRMASVLISYGTTLRRNGNIKGALNIFNEVIYRFPSEQKNAMWAIGWTHYLSGNYKNALEIFSHLYSTYADSRYLYWKSKCEEKLGIARPAKALYGTRHIRHRDYYGYLSLLRDGQTLKTVEISQPPIPAKGMRGQVSMNSPQIDRVDILAEIGLTREAVSELLHMSRKNPSPDMVVSISSYLQRLGNYRMSVGIISRIPYNRELHEFHYPLAFLSEVEYAAQKNRIDPLLILAVMREESRFDPEARSIAGARGLLQLMPGTAQRIAKPANVSLGHLNQLYDPKTNVLLGTYYLRQLLDTFNSLPVALAAYNAGAHVVSDWLERGNYNTIDEFIEDIPFRETRNYVKRVLTTYFEYIRASENSDISEVSKYIGNL